MKKINNIEKIGDLTEDFVYEIDAPKDQKYYVGVYYGSELEHERLLTAFAYELFLKNGGTELPENIYERSLIFYQFYKTQQKNIHMKFEEEKKKHGDESKYINYYPCINIVGSAKNKSKKDALISKLIKQKAHLGGDIFSALLGKPLALPVSISNNKNIHEDSNKLFQHNIKTEKYLQDLEIERKELLLKKNNGVLKNKANISNEELEKRKELSKLDETEIEKKLDTIQKSEKIICKLIVEEEKEPSTVDNIKEIEKKIGDYKIGEIIKPE